MVGKADTTDVRGGPGLAGTLLDGDAHLDGVDVDEVGAGEARNPAQDADSTSAVPALL